MRAAALILAKDLRLAVRTPAVLLALVAYPVLVALLVALAVQGEERRPRIAVVNEDVSGRTVEVGGRRLSVDDYLDRLAEEVDVSLLDPAAAADALDAGRVSAVLTVPENFVADLQSGVRQPVLGLATSRRSPVVADAVARRLEAAVFRLNQRLAVGYVDQVLRLVDLAVHGGRTGVWGRSGDALGLRRSRQLVLSVQRELRAAGEADIAARLDPLVGFIDETGDNLDLATPTANAIRAPIQLDVTTAVEGREPLSAFGVAGTLLVSLGLAGVLLAAAAISAEREDRTLVRLGRGLVPSWALVGGKMVLTALICLGVGLVLLAGVALLTSLEIGRWALWPPALTLAGLAFAGVGVLAGALARETRTALLGAFMLALPLIALGLLEDSAIASSASWVVPFAPAFDAFRALLVEPRLRGGELAPALVHLTLLAAVLGSAAALVTRRRADA